MGGEGPMGRGVSENHDNDEEDDMSKWHVISIWLMMITLMPLGLPSSHYYLGSLLPGWELLKCLRSLQ